MKDYDSHMVRYECDEGRLETPSLIGYLYVGLDNERIDYHKD